MRLLLFFLIASGAIHLVQSQTKIEKSIAVNANQKVDMYFKYPELITIKTWDQQNIKVVAMVDINKGQNDDAFEIEVDEGETLRINSNVRNYDQLPRNIVIRYKGEDYFFNTENPRSPQIMKFKEEISGGGYEYMRNGVIMDVKLEIMVPKNVSLDVDAKFGMVEVYGFSDQLEISSKFGGIDVSVPSQSPSMKVRTKFGDVYSNLDMNFSSADKSEIGRWLTLEGKGTNSAQQYFKSEFGNVYLRKM